jgi:hypothetical protein
LEPLYIKSLHLSLQEGILQKKKEHPVKRPNKVNKKIVKAKKSIKSLKETPLTTKKINQVNKGRKRGREKIRKRNDCS